MVTLFLYQSLKYKNRLMINTININIAQIGNVSIQNNILNKAIINKIVMVTPANNQIIMHSHIYMK